jgi:hypothetical protein
MHKIVQPTVYSMQGEADRACIITLDQARKQASAPPSDASGCAPNQDVQSSQGC